MPASTLKCQLTQNIGADEEVRFTKHRLGLEIHRIHGEKHMRHIMPPIQMEAMREELFDRYLAELLEMMAIKLRS